MQVIASQEFQYVCNVITKSTQQVDCLILESHVKRVDSKLADQSIRVLESLAESIVETSVTLDL